MQALLSRWAWKEGYLFKAHPDRRTQIRAKAERSRKITLCRVYFWFCLSTLSKTTIPCKQRHYKALNHRVHFWKRISSKIIVRVHFWKNNFHKNVPHVYFWKSKSKINIFRVFFSWLLHSFERIFWVHCEKWVLESKVRCKKCRYTPKIHCIFCDSVVYYICSMR